MVLQVFVDIIKDKLVLNCQLIWYHLLQKDIIPYVLLRKYKSINHAFIVEFLRILRIWKVYCMIFIRRLHCQSVAIVQMRTHGFHYSYIAHLLLITLRCRKHMNNGKLHVTLQVIIDIILIFDFWYII